MRIHYLQHVPFETPERIAAWVKEKGHELTSTCLYESTHFPLLSEFDLLVVLGGPMGVYEEKEFPWLAHEKQFIKEAVQSRKLVLGICLGAQLIAEIIGGKVYKNEVKEIGWFPVKRMAGAGSSLFFKDFPEEFVPFHWHGDTFQLPDQAEKMAFSPGCANQAYVYEEHVVGLQFHLESSDASIRKLIEHGEADLEQGIYVQRPTEMLGQTEFLTQSNKILFALLDAMEHKHHSSREHI